MKTNPDKQSAVWQAAFNEGLARGEAAYSAGGRDARDFAESYANLVEAEHLKASEPPTPASASEAKTSPDEARAAWAKAFGNISREAASEHGDSAKAEETKAMWAKAFERIAD